GNGKRKVFYSRTRKEVADKLKDALHEQQQGTIVVSSTQTVAQFLTDWLENVHRRRLRPRTFERYSEVINLHIIPALGRYQLQKLTAQHVQKFYTQKEDEGLASTTIHYYHSVLHNALNTAVKWGLIAKRVSDSHDDGRHCLSRVSLCERQKVREPAKAA
ncbi:MAG TPA: N-terminal phage integrase SAM-like domain-containing protein, partial [Ktedonosporobacter sp.]|nr:N-terminal phage integrase SAM-like domain-containing protein [Ktedonosporobacter sp.]